MDTNFYYYSFYNLMVKLKLVLEIKIFFMSEIYRILKNLSENFIIKIFK